MDRLTFVNIATFFLPTWLWSKLSIIPKVM